MLKGLFKTIKNTITGDQLNQSVIVQNVKTVAGKIIQKKYLKEKLLGCGAFANCYITKNIQTGKLYATKIISKDNRNRVKLLNQLLVHQQLHHPNIVDFSHAFQDKHDIYVFLQLCPNNTVQHKILKKGLNKTQIKRMFYEVIQAMIYMHSKNIIHRDIKPRNIFLGKNNQIKIGDFGLATKLQFQGQRKRTMCGTPQYMPPQMIQGCGYGKQVDIWGVGILLYEIYVGVTPFFDKSNEKIIQNISNINYPINEKGVPKEAMNLIQKMLMRNPQLRPTWQEILDSPYFDDQIGQEVSSVKAPSPISSFKINFQHPTTYTARSPNKTKQFEITPRNFTAENAKNEQDLVFFQKLTRRGSSKTQTEQFLNSIYYVVQTFQIEQDLIGYKMNNGPVGILMKDSQVVHQGLSFKHILLDKKGQNTIIQDSSKLSPKLKIMHQSCKRKFKNCKSPIIQSINDPIIYLMKYSKHKNMQMLRLSNSNVQLKFKDNISALIQLDDKSKGCIKIINENAISDLEIVDIMEQNKERIKQLTIDKQKLGLIKKFLVSLGLLQKVQKIQENNKNLIKNLKKQQENPQIQNKSSQKISLSKLQLKSLQRQQDQGGLRQNVINA